MRKTKKLHLNAETVRQLSVGTLANVAGAGTADTCVGANSDLCTTTQQPQRCTRGFTGCQHTLNRICETLGNTQDC